MTSIRALLCLLVVAFVPTLAGAQAPGDVLVQDEESIQFLVSWGFNGQSMIAERWTPVRVYVWSGADAVSGTLEISYRQDASQSMRIVAPFSTTPGRAVPIETALALPSGCQSVSVRLLSERGRRLRARTFSRSSSRDDEQMPQILASTGVPLLNLGQTGIEQVSTAIVGETFGADQRTRTSPASDLWSRLTIFKSAPLDMPSSWMAYDALGVVVLESSRVSAIPRASLDALAQRYDAVNIKLDKTGGLTEALATAERARALGLKVMVGSMVATSLSMAPALLLAQDADWVDLDGPLLLEADRTPGLTYEADMVLPPVPALWG